MSTFNLKANFYSAWNADSFPSGYQNHKIDHTPDGLTKSYLYCLYSNIHNKYTYAYFWKVKVIMHLDKR